MMLIALDENNRLLHIDQAERGLACNCTCFECGESVLARKGEIIEHHFAHANNKDSCVINPESLLHKYAKDIIIESMQLILPSVPNSKIPAVCWVFDEIAAECNLGKIRPNLVARSSETTIFIEIAVTHFIDQEKLKIIQSMNIKTIEIDLSNFLTKDLIIPNDEIKQKVLESLENKRWVYPQEQKTNNESNANENTVSTLSSNINQPTWEDFKFKINGMWVNARKFSGGMLSVSCIYNPEIIAMLKKWRNEGGGQYNTKYKSWNYWQPFSETVLDRLSQMHSIEKS